MVLRFSGQLTEQNADVLRSSAASGNAHSVAPELRLRGPPVPDAGPRSGGRRRLHRARVLRWAYSPSADSSSEPGGTYMAVCPAVPESWCRRVNISSALVSLWPDWRLS